MAPTIVIAGVRSGVGKTTIATGIMGALTRRGLSVQPFKAGPDYIDPSYHKLACGVPSRNLDTWLLPHSTVLELFQRASGRGDISVIEGVMGVFDGHSSLSEEGSTAELAKLLGAPVILVADAAKVARSVAAEILGYQRFDPGLNIAGVILNGVGGPRHLDFCKPQIEATTGLPVLGYLPRREDLVQPERHMGLIPTVEGTVARKWYDTLIAQIEETIDLDLLMAVANSAAGTNAVAEAYPESPQPKRAVIAVAQDKAFSFYYQDSLDLLEAWGAELAPFSPLEDERLPEGIGGIYLGIFTPPEAAGIGATGALSLAVLARRTCIRSWRTRKSGSPRALSAMISPSTSRSRGRVDPGTSASCGSATSGQATVTSFALRLHSRTCPSVTSARIRTPSHLTS